MLNDHYWNKQNSPDIPNTELFNRYSGSFCIGFLKSTFHLTLLTYRYLVWSKLNSSSAFQPPRRTTFNFNWQYSSIRLHQLSELWEYLTPMKEKATNWKWNKHSIWEKNRVFSRWLIIFHRTLEQESFLSENFAIVLRWRISKCWIHSLQWTASDVWHSWNMWTSEIPLEN